MPDRSNDYQLPSWPLTKITREIWNAVLGDIGVRLRDRETLEASFELLQQQGIQAALDYIQVSIAPQLSALQQTIQQSKEQIDDLLQGNAPNAHKLGGQLPAYYAKAADVESLLQVVEDKADANDVTTMIQQRIAALVDSSPATLDTLKELAAALGNDANFATTMANALANLETKIKQAGAPIGTTIMVQGNGSTPPPGYLLHNGAPCTAAYPELRTYLLANGATVNGNGDPIIEDMGGYFPRGWRPGQVVDSGRVFGAAQQDAFQGHRVEMANASSSTASTMVSSAAGAQVTQGVKLVGNITGRVSNDNAGTVVAGSAVFNSGRFTDDDVNGAPRVSKETRPSNKTFTFWIKAYAADQVPGSADFAALANNVQGHDVRINALEGFGKIRALANLNGTGTIALRYSRNIASVIDNGNGDYSFNFITPEPDANYIVVGSAGSGAGANSSVNPVSKTTTGFRINTSAITAGYMVGTGSADFSEINVAVLR